MPKEQPPFQSLKQVFEAVQQEKNLSPKLFRDLIAITLDQFRNEQAVLHFETKDRSLGPGYLIGYNADDQWVEIQLRGESQIRRFAFSEIKDFSPAPYENPQTMGEALFGAFWEAKVTRRYLEPIVANSYARLSPEEVDSFEKIVNIDQTEVAHLVPLALPEREVKQYLCEIIGYPMIPKDWGEKLAIFSVICVFAEDRFLLPSF